MKLFSILFLLFLSCTHKTFVRNININQTEISKIYKKPMLILSCIKCGCFVDVFKAKDFLNQQTLKKYDIYVDTLCLSKTIFPQQVYHLSSSKLDSIYEENYNIILVKKINENSFKSILLETEASKKMNKILENFISK